MVSASPAWINVEELEKLSPSERAEVESILAEFLQAIEDNPLIAYNNPDLVPFGGKVHQKQLDYHAAKTRYKVLQAGNRFGKSFAGAADDLIQALPEEALPDHLRPFKRWGLAEPFRGRIFTPDLGSTMDEVHYAFKALCPPNEFRGGTWDKAYAKADRILHFACGSTIDFFSHDQDLDQMGSVSRHRIRFDEEPPEDIFKASRKRVIDTGGDLCFTFTPELGISWTHARFAERAEEPDVTVIRGGMADNPYISPKEIEEYTKDLTDEERRIALYGDYVALGGLFYNEFTDRLHVVDPPGQKHVKGQTIVVGIDPGFNTTAVIYCAFDNDNDCLVFDEIYLKEKLPTDIADAIKERNEFWKVDPVYVIDPSARNRATVNAEQVEAAFAREGIYCAHGYNPRGPGITEVKRRLQHNHLVISRDCHNLRREFPRYQRNPKSTDEWEAIKVNDHGLDALRYAVMSRTWNLPKSTPKTRQYDPFKQEPPFRPKPQPVGPLGAWS